ncbi:hypothetical protein BSF38_00308 [Paludisphaera borealis]|uniref:Uncharacterized protein n=1 Tax=Paludisphaera borealis TaxID=1387353 RepID=A0A1U7CJ15_9BACT|nr:hypothetical protein BSF38_00308 [Paludisphaera borealis]
MAPCSFSIRYHGSDRATEADTTEPRTAIGPGAARFFHLTVCRAEFTSRRARLLPRPSEIGFVRAVFAISPPRLGSRKLGSSVAISSAVRPPTPCPVIGFVRRDSAHVGRGEIGFARSRSRWALLVFAAWLVVLIRRKLDIGKEISAVEFVRSSSRSQRKLGSFVAVSARGDGYAIGFDRPDFQPWGAPGQPVRLGSIVAFPRFPNHDVRRSPSVEIGLVRHRFAVGPAVLGRTGLVGERRQSRLIYYL